MNRSLCWRKSASHSRASTSKWLRVQIPLQMSGIIPLNMKSTTYNWTNLTPASVWLYQTKLSVTKGSILDSVQGIPIACWNVLHPDLFWAQDSKPQNIKSYVFRTWHVRCRAALETITFGARFLVNWHNWCEKILRGRVLREKMVKKIKYNLFLEMNWVFYE